MAATARKHSDVPGREIEFSFVEDGNGRQRDLYLTNILPRDGSGPKILRIVIELDRPRGKIVFSIASRNSGRPHIQYFTCIAQVRLSADLRAAAMEKEALRYASKWDHNIKRVIIEWESIGRERFIPSEDKPGMFVPRS